MKRRTFIKKTGAAGFITLFAPSDIIQSFYEPHGQLEENFQNPPDAAFPQTYWFWMNGHVTKEGITLDLEAMKQAGIGGVFNFDVGTGIPKGPVAYLSEEWWELKKHAIREAERLGLEFTMHNCPGWSASGGPWITPEFAMQQITWSETYLAGGQSIHLDLPKPPHRLGHYRDIAVIAFPSLEQEKLLQTVKISAVGSINIDNAANKNEGITVQAAKGKKASLQLEFPEPYEARLINFFITAVASPETKAIPNKPLEYGERTSVDLEASDDGIRFRLVTVINTGVETELLAGDKFIVFDIPVTKAKYFRLSSSGTRKYRQVQFSGITRLKNWFEKGNHRARTVAYVNEPSAIININDQNVPSGSVIHLDAVLDITSNVNKDGLLKWNAPRGDWTILRIGFTPTGTLNRAAPDNGVGLECDKYSQSAFDIHFNKMMERFLPLIKQLASKGKAGLEIDSYEAGTQNWTKGFESIFHKQKGYDLIQYLPALAGGRIVDSVDTTERFLWDIRKVQADLIAENYYGRFHELCQQHGITSYIEPYDSGPMEEMQIGSKADSNLCEFWNGISSVFPAKAPALRTPKLASSIAHINGQKIVGAEAFTAEPDSGRWQEYPFALKAVGDKAFVKGVNRIVVHRYAHQPHPSAAPGMTMGPWGIHFDRTNTWWHQGKAWLKYLARCQTMLQEGRFVADLVYFTGEDANMYTRVNADELNPAPPQGYDYDVINADVILKHLTISNGQIVLANRMRYQVFILQDYKIVTLDLLRKLRDLVQQGMILVGMKPERSAGIISNTNEYAAFREITNELWGNINGTDITENRFGKGRVIWGQPLTSILQSLHIKPDFEFSSGSGDAPVIYIHRKTEEADIYFISNQRRTYEELVATFRVKNKQPEIWNAGTGKIIRLPAYELLDEQVRLPLQMEPYGSLFVVFRSPAPHTQLHTLTRDNQTIWSTKNFTHSTRRLYKEVKNNFTIFFLAKPEINILLNPDFVMGSISEPWTEYYAVYPQSGKQLYGEGHATSGITVGRNGVAIWENATGTPALVLAVSIAISGWSAITVVYTNGVPAVYVNGNLIRRGKQSKNIVHPASDKAYLNEGASYYNGDMSEPLLFTEPLSNERIQQLDTAVPTTNDSPFSVEMAESKKPTLMIKRNGRYVLRNSAGKTSSFTISGISEPFILEGPWQVHFPLASPAQIILPQLISLHKHTDEAVKYFSGTAFYTKKFILPAGSLKSKRWILNLGRVEVIAEIKLNSKHYGTLWKRPYSVDVSDALIEGSNTLEIKITNQWPNRLIGDEQLPNPDQFTPGGSASGIEGLTGGGIERLPDWYTKGNTKPLNGRVSFTTWKHYKKDSPLLESGLIGPVILQPAILKSL